MKTRRTLNTVIYGFVLTATLGFSGASLAQADAIDSLRQDTDQTNDETATPNSNHAIADRLRNTLDDYYDRPTAHFKDNGDAVANPAFQPSPISKRLAATLGDYYGEIADSQTAEAGVPSSDIRQNSYPLAEDLAERLETYYQTTGNRN